ncbi:MAG: hypothetical protein K2O04_06655 [Clostridiales bacterium]|nr:hypothetical protein [Clostridiales bacterium]
MENTLDTEKLYSAFKAITINILVNDYAVERVAFGYEKPGDKAPIDLYLDHLRLDINDGIFKRTDIPGVYIDQQERISAEQGYAEYVRNLFVSQMERIFMDAPKDMRLERECDDIPLKPRSRDYLFGLLPLFTKVLNVEVEYDFFDLIPTNNEARAAEYGKWQRFVTAILLRPIRAGSQINRYIKDFTNPPYYVSKLIEKKGKDFYLKPVDINSYEYIFALFSLMNFKNDKNGKLLELKMRELERRL